MCIRDRRERDRERERQTDRQRNSCHYLSSLLVCVLILPIPDVFRRIKQVYYYCS